MEEIEKEKPEKEPVRIDFVSEKKRLDYGLTNPHDRWCSSVQRKIEGTTAGNDNTSRLKIDKVARSYDARSSSIS